MSKSQTVKFLIVGVFGSAMSASLARADFCPELFAPFSRIEWTEQPQTSVSQKLIIPAVARFVQLMEQKRLPENRATTARFRIVSPFLQAMTWNENQAAPLSEGNTQIFRLRDKSPKRPEYQILTTVTRIVSKSERFEQMLVQEKAARDLRRGSGAPKNHVFEAFRRTQDERKKIGDMTRYEMEFATILPLEFSIVYAQTFKLIRYAGDAGAALSSSVPWTSYVRPVDYPSLKHLAMIARAMNSGLASRRHADNLILETLRTEFAPALDVTLDVGVQTR